MRKLIKNLAHLLRTTAIVSVMALPLVFSGCKTPDDEIMDTISPKISISSPLSQKGYDSNTVPFNWVIEEANFESAPHFGGQFEPAKDGKGHGCLVLEKPYTFG